VKNIIIYIITFILISCDFGEHQSTLIGVYPGAGHKVSFINSNTLRVDRTANLYSLDSLSLFNACISTNKDYLLFTGIANNSNNRAYVIAYNIADDKVDTVMSIGIEKPGNPKLYAAHKFDEPYLVYFYSHLNGLFAIDFISGTVEEISNENHISINFYHSKINKWLVINKYYPGCVDNYTELQFYNAQSRLQESSFSLNENDRDSLDVVDLEFSEDGNIVYLSYLLSKRLAVYESAFFGSYDLITKTLNTSHVTLPWSDIPYCLTYNNEKNECYMVGESSLFYIIGIDSSEYYIKDIIELNDKIYGPSEILVSSDGRKVFVSCYNNNAVYIIEIRKNVNIKTVSIEYPFQLFLI
jgi:hypothetical protein